jgi:hypothetical protein
MESQEIHYTITNDERPGLVRLWHQKRGYCGQQASHEELLIVTQDQRRVNCRGCRAKIRGLPSHMNFTNF